MYHYVRDLQNSRYPRIKGLDINLFKGQINYLRKNYHVISMEEIIYSIENKTKIPDKSVLLTFDDAYADHYENVFPILDKYNLQGSFFTPSKAITEHRVLDVNKIHFIISAVEDELILLNDVKQSIISFQREYQLEDFDFYYKKLAWESRMDTKNIIFIKRLLQVELIEELRIKILDVLFEKYIGISESSFSRELYMNEDQLKHLVRSGQHVGNHGHNHFWWNNLSKDEMDQELDLSISFLKRIGVDMNNWTASYPYGSYDDQSIRMLEDRGCKLAVTTDVDIATTNESARFVMPRLDTNDVPKNENEKPNFWYEKG